MLKPNIPENDIERTVLLMAYTHAADAMVAAINAVYRTIPQAKLYYHTHADRPDDCPVDRMADATRRFVRQIETLEKLKNHFFKIAIHLEATTFTGIPLADTGRPSNEDK
jgi:hypothetical protein